MDTWCKMYVDHNGSLEELMGLLQRAIGGRRMPGCIEGDSLQVDPMRNDRFDTPFSNDPLDRFLECKWYLEVEPRPGVSEEQYVSQVGVLMESLYRHGLSVVTACSFEDLLPGGGRMEHA